MSKCIFVCFHFVIFPDLIMMMVGTPDPSSSCVPLAAWLHSLVIWKALLLFLFEESRNVLKQWCAGFSTKGKDVSAHISLFVL